LKKHPVGTSFSNGVALQQYFTFKIILTLPNGDMTTENISDRYHKFLGTGIAQPSLVRALHALDTIGLIKFVDNPFDNRMKSIGLSKQGKKMQYLFMGSNRVYPQMETAVTQTRKGTASLWSA
tara:strand:- start:1083 stop:1451 length:369 start_codon:yes stop_codon:yes gene_type:complete